MALRKQESSAHFVSADSQTHPVCKEEGQIVSHIKKE